MNSKPKRHRLQFGLRALLLLTTGAAILLGWMLHGVRQQRIAIEALEQMGCSVEYNAIDRSSVPEWLGKLLGGNAFRTVNSVVCRPPANDAALAHLEGLKQLQNLLLNDTAVTDAGLTHLQGLKELRYLNLEGTQITDAGLAKLQGFSQLRILVLRGTQVTDKGIEHLRGLTLLEQLFLDRTQVTNAGVRRLASLTSLQELWLRPGPALDAGVQELQKALPKLRVLRVN